MSTTQTHNRDSRETFNPELPVKRRRISLPKAEFSPHYGSLFAGVDQKREDSLSVGAEVKDNCQDEKTDISFSALSKHADQTVAPFLAKHIPDQYAPAGGTDDNVRGKRKDPNTKYCYRHRPDLKCRRQADEPSMDQLQHVCQSIAYIPSHG